MDVIAALLCLAELVVFSLGVFVWLRNQKQTFSVATALSLGIISSLGLVSLLFQICFLIGMPAASFPLEGAAVVGMIGVNRHQWSTLDDLRQALVTTWERAPVTVSVMAISLTYLFLQAVLLPPSSWDALTYHLPRVLLWEQNHSLFLRDYTIAPQTAFPVGSDILFHLFLRFRTDYGLGIFSWLSYVSMFLGTYGLVRHAVSHRIALTTAIVIVCLPEIIYQSTGTKNDIILAAVALASVLWADQWSRTPSLLSLWGLGVTLCFGVAVKTSFVLFALFFIPLWLSLLFQKGQLTTLIRLVFKRWRSGLLFLMPAALLSQAWLFWDNYQQFGEWLGPAEFAFRNQNNEGLFGGVANVVRYSLQGIHLLQPVDSFWGYLSGTPITSGLQSIYDAFLDPLFGKAGFAEFIKNAPFEVLWQPQEDTSWFGPLSVFLVFPAGVWCLVKAQKLPRILSLVAVCLFLALSYRIGWSPWKTRFFTLVLVCTGPCIATFLSDLRVKDWMLKTIRWVSLAILVYACLYNYSKPIIPSDFYTARENIWLRSDWTRDRQVYDHIYRGRQTELISQAIAGANKVAIVGYDHYFSLLFRNPDIEFILLPPEQRERETLSIQSIQDRLTEMDYLVCFSKRCDSTTVDIDLDLQWNNDGNFGGIPEVYEIIPTGNVSN